MSYYHQALRVLSDSSKDFAEVVRIADIELYGKVALASLLFYYTISTMDKEVKFFWFKPLRFVNFMYFLNRYIGLFSILISIQLHVFGVSKRLCRCASITWIHNISDWATVLLIDYILLIRVLALYSQDRRLSFTLTTLLFIEASLRLACMIGAVHAEVASQKHLPEAISCVEQSKCSYAALETTYWVAPAVFQTLLLVLALYKSIDFWRLSASLSFNGLILVKVLVRDQVAYYFIAIACSVMNIIKCHIDRGPMWGGVLTVLGSTSLSCLLGSELLFNLKGACEQGMNEGTNCTPRSVTVSDVHFAEPSTVHS